MLKKNAPNTSKHAYTHTQHWKIDTFSIKCIKKTYMLSCSCYFTGHWSHSSLPLRSQRGRGLTLMYVSFKWSIWWNNCMITGAEKAWNNCCAHWFLLGYPQEKDGERPSGAADSDWRPLWTEEERRGGADWTQRQDCKWLVHTVFPCVYLEKRFRIIEICVSQSSWLGFFYYRRAVGQKELSSSVWGLRKNGTGRHVLRWLMLNIVLHMLF